MHRCDLSSISRGGLMVGMSPDGHHFYYVSSDTHSLTVGATRSGKSRCLVLPSIGLTAMAGESMVIVDMKGELYTYSKPFLEANSYEVIAVDFSAPEYSNHYNFLQPTIDALNLGDTAKATAAARDIATMLIPENQTNERIWVDGARATLTLASLICAYENTTRPQYQNLANVQQFMTHMCKPIGQFGTLPLNVYLSLLPDDHPAVLAQGIPDIAPSKMRGSFFTEVLSTLNLFVDPHIHAMTSYSDFDPELTGVRKRAIFVILPDYKMTYYQIAALFVYQQYQILAESSVKHGGRLPRRVHFFCDEFGNFVKIPNFDTLMTVSGGRGILWHLFVQNTEQLDEKYGDRIGRTIRANAETWVYLSSNSDATQEEISKRLGNYTIKSPSLSGSTGGQSSASYNLTGRPLMFPNEIHNHIKRPYQLVMTNNRPAVMYAPDLSETLWNDAFGLGDMEYNKQLTVLRAKNRIKQPKVNLELWGIWKKYIAQILAAEAAANMKGK